MNKINHLILAFVTVFASLSSSAMEGPAGVENLPKYVINPYYNQSIVNFVTLTAPKLTKIGWYTETEKAWVASLAQAQALEKACVAKLHKGITSTTNALDGLDTNQIVALLQRRTAELTEFRSKLSDVLESAAVAALKLDSKSGVRLEIATLLSKLDVEIDAVSQVVQTLQPKDEVQNVPNPFAALSFGAPSVPLLDGSSSTEPANSARPMAPDVIGFMQAAKEDSQRKDQMLFALKNELDTLKAALKNELDSLQAKSDGILAHHQNSDVNPKLVALLAKNVMVAQSKVRELEENNLGQTTRIEELDEVIEGLRTSKSRRNWAIGLMTVGIGAMGYLLVPSEMLLAAQTLVTETTQTLATELGKTEAVATALRYLATI